MTALHIPQPEPDARPVVTTQREYGARGAAVTHARYSRRQFQKWGRKGGRPRNPTWAEIQAATGVSRTRKRAVSARRPTTSNATGGRGTP